MERDDIKSQAEDGDRKSEIHSTPSQPQAEKARAKIQDSEVVPEPTNVAPTKRVYKSAIFLK